MGLVWEPGAELVPGAAAFPGSEMPVSPGPAWQEAGEYGGSLLGGPSRAGSAVQMFGEARRGSERLSLIRRCSKPCELSRTASGTATDQFPDLGCSGENIVFEELLEVRSLTKTLEFAFKT